MLDVRIEVQMLLAHRLLFSLISCAFLASCAAEGTVPETENTAPIANAGTPIEASIGETVTLNGAGSIDPDGDPLSFRWTLSKPAGSFAELSSANFVETQFEPDIEGEYVATLVVNDGLLDSSPDSVTITATIGGGNQDNQAPVAEAGEDQNVQVGMMVSLDGTESSDPDGDPLTFDWLLEGKPDGSTAELSSTMAPRPTFQPDVAGVYEISLVVSDGQLQSPPSTVLVEAFAGNAPPRANAGPDQTVATGSRVQLDGSSSIDVDGDSLTYIWSITGRPAGSTATLSSAEAANPSFEADVDGDYTVQLIVNDGMQSSEPDTVTITATTENVPPMAHAGTDREVAVGSTVQLDGSMSIDPNEDPLNYEWTLKSRPAGSNASLSDPNIVDPTFEADVEGIYVAELRVDDGAMTSLPDSITITATLNNVAPIADAGTDQGVDTGSVATLDGTNSSDDDGDALSYQWTFAGKPLGSTATLMDETTATPSFTPDLDGTYVVQLVVNDGTVDSSPDNVVVTAATPSAPSPSSRGDVLITEFMADPTVVEDTNGGEWFELYNTSSTVTYDIQNCIVEDLGSNSFTVQLSVEIPPQSYITLAKGSSPGFTPHYVYPTGFQLANNTTTGDEIILSCNGVGIDDVAWGSTLGPDFTITAGESNALLDDEYDADDNDDGSLWCAGTNVYNMSGSESDKGTPGLANGITGSCP